MVAKLLPADAQGREDPRQGDRSGSLHIIVEGTDLLAILLQDASPVAGSKIFPVQQGVGKQPRGCLDIGIDEGIVALSPHPGVTIAQVERVIEQAFPIGTDIEHHRDHAGRINARRRRVNGQLANRDLDAPHTPVANAQDFLRIGGDNQVNLIGPGTDIAKRRLDVFWVIDREVDPTWTPIFVAVLLNGQSDGGIIDHR